MLVGPDIASDGGGTMSAVFAAAAVAAVIRKKAENMQRLQLIIQTFV